MACVSIWKKVRLTRPNARLVIIIPSCLRVDRAIIFFMSCSVVALSPAISIVDTAVNNKILLNSGSKLRKG
jgi:hypothetical protein